MTTGLQSLKDTFVKRAKGGSIRRFSLSMSAAVLGRLSLLVLAILVARNLGVSDYGAFTFATGLAVVFGQLAGLGWPSLVNRLLPRFKNSKSWADLSGLVKASTAVTLTAATVLSIFLAFASLIAGDLSQSLILAAFLIIPFALCILRRQQLAALKKPQWGMLLDQGFGAFLTIVFLVLLGNINLQSTILTYAFATLSGTLISMALVRKFIPKQTASIQPSYKFRLWMAAAFPIMLGLSAKLLLGKTDVFLLAPLAGLKEAGIYGAAWRLTYLVTFPQLVLMTLVTPAISEAFAKHQMRRARQVVRYSLAFTTATTVPLVLAFTIFGKPIIFVIFGQGFGESTVPLIILAFGQQALSYSMVFSTVLMMGGRERQFAVLNVLLLGINLVASILLIPCYGAVGAALAMTGTAAIALVSQAWLAWYFLLRKDSSVQG